MFLLVRHSDTHEDRKRDQSIIDADPDQLLTAVTATLDGLTRLAMSNPERFRLHFPDASIILAMLKPPAARSEREQ